MTDGTGEDAARAGRSGASSTPARKPTSYPRAASVVATSLLVGLLATADVLT